MTTFVTTIRNRRLECDVPADWPDGIQVEIHPVGPTTAGDTGKMSPEEIARTLAAMDLMQPLQMTEGE